MNAKTLKFAAILCFILAAGLVFQTVWTAICLPPVNGSQRQQLWGFLAIGIFIPLLSGCLGWSLWRKANAPANANRGNSAFKINSPLKILGLIFIGIICFLMPGLLLLALLGYYFWQKRSAKIPPLLVPPPENFIPQPVAVKDNKLCQSGWLCMVLAVVLPIFMLLAGKFLFPNNGQACGMLFTGFGLGPAMLLDAAALVLAIMSLAQREPRRWQSILLLILALSPAGEVVYCILYR